MSLPRRKRLANWLTRSASCARGLDRMGLFDRHAALLERYQAAKDAGIDPLRVRLQQVLSPTEAMVNGQRTLMVGTNNYLGLTFDESCVESAVEALRSEGTGTTGSRTANGSYDQHE